MALLVDEAHGAHLSFHRSLPPAALRSGADACVHSLHKSAGGLTQTALLHVRGGLVDRRRLRQAASLLQTTSPSYLLMGSIDAARRELALNGEALVEEALKLAGKARRLLSCLEGLTVPGTAYAPRPGVAFLDPTRLVVNVRRAGLLGTWVEAALRAKGVQVEYSDPFNLVVPVSPWDTENEVDRLVAALAGILRAGGGTCWRAGRDGWQDWIGRYRAGNGPGGEGRAEEPLKDLAETLCGLWAHRPAPAAGLLEALSARCEMVPLEEAAGRVSGELVCPYPPGIPALVPGDLVTAAVVAGLAAMRDLGVRFQGAADPGLRNLSIITRWGS